jgi:hypothetical protein
MRNPYANPALPTLQLVAPQNARIRCLARPRKQNGAILRRFYLGGAILRRFYLGGAILRRFT